MGIWNWAEKVVDAIVTVADVAIEASFKVAEAVGNVAQGVLFVGQCLFFPSAFHTALWNGGVFVASNVLNIVLIQPLHAIRDMIPTSALQVIFNSPNTRALLQSNLPMNLTILALVLVQQELMRTTDEDEIDNLAFIRNLYMTGIASHLLTAFRWRVQFHNQIDRAAINWALTDTVIAEHPNNEHFTPCQHDFSSMKNDSALEKVSKTVSLGKAYIEYPITIAGRFTELFLLSFIVNKNDPLQKYSYLLLVCMAEGQSVWTYKLDSAGICPADQQHWFNANNTYFAAWGALFNYITYLTSQYVMEDNPAVFAAVHNLLYPLFIIATLTVTMPPPNKPVEGKKLVWDAFEPGRGISKFALKKLAEIVGYFTTNKEGNAVTMLLNAAGKIPAPVKAAFADKDLFTVRSAVTERASINKLVEISGAKWQAGIQTFKRYTNVPGSTYLPTVADFIPSFVNGSKVIKLGAAAIFGNDLRPPLRWVHTEIGHGIKAAKEKKLRLLSAEFQKNLNAAAAIPNEIDRGWETVETTSEKNETQEPGPSSLGQDNTFLGQAPQHVLLNEYNPDTDKGKEKDFITPAINEEKISSPVAQPLVAVQPSMTVPTLKEEKTKSPLTTHAVLFKTLNQVNDDWEEISTTNPVILPEPPLESITDDDWEMVSEDPDWEVVEDDKPKKPAAGADFQGRSPLSNVLPEGNRSVRSRRD